jgi:hypothetical protein
MGRKILAVIVGAVVAVLFISGVEAVAHVIYPPPPGMKFDDPAVIKAFVDSMPLGAFLMVLLAHALGSLAGPAAATLAGGRTSLIPGVIVGALLLAAGIMNAAMLPHPVWFKIVDLAVYLPLAYLSARLTLKQPPPSASAPVPAT